MRGRGESRGLTAGGDCGGIDKFFLEVGETPSGPGLPPPMAGPPPREFLEHLVEVASRYGMDIELPPG